MTERARGLGRKNKRGDRKGESNDSPDIPDRRETSHIPGLPSGVNVNKCLDKKFVQSEDSISTVFKS